MYENYSATSKCHIASIEDCCKSETPYSISDFHEFLMNRVFVKVSYNKNLVSNKSFVPMILILMSFG